MSEEKNNGCLKAFMIFCVLNMLLLAGIGAGYFVIWKKNGSPSMAEIKAKLEEKGGVQLTGADESGHSGGEQESRRPIVASAPIQAGADTYARYTARTDVLTLVNYYSDT